MFNLMALEPRCGALRPGALQLGGASTGYRHWRFTPSIRVEILGVNIQCSSFSKRKMVRSENVLVSIGKFKRKRKNALIKSIAYNF